MKWLFHTIIFIFLLQTVSASYVLLNHEPVVIGGKTYELSGMGETDVYVKIDGKTSTVTKTLELVNGVWMQLLYINMPYGNNPLTAEIDIFTEYTCGNKVCENDKGENADNCCTDCNCTGNYTCVINRCIKSSLNKCFTNEQCDDKQACTTDICTGFPLACIHNKTLECVTGDSCCPEDCNKTIDYMNNDWDCLPPPTCTKDVNCTDNDESTIDICDSRTKTCRFEVMVIKGQPIKESTVSVSDTENKTEGNFTAKGLGVGSAAEKAVDYAPAFIGVLGIFGAIYIISITIFKKYRNHNNSDGQQKEQ